MQFSKNFIFLISSYLLCLQCHKTFGGDVALGTGHREQSGRDSSTITDDAEPDPNKKLDRIHCKGEIINLAFDEFVKFKLNKKTCSVSVIGSLTYNCTASLVCSKLDFPDPVDGQCSQGHLSVYDSLGGGMTLCGKKAFGGPFKSSRGGTDLYITYDTPNTKNTMCMAVCDEDRTRKDELVAKPIPNDYSRKHEANCVCGTNLQKSSWTSGARGRIVGGTNADPFEFPFLAAIVTKHTRKSFCSGSLINDRYILTAAHCFSGMSSVYPDDVDILLHSHVLDFNPNQKYDPHAASGEEGSVKEVSGYHIPPRSDEDESTIRSAVEAIYVHPLYSSKTNDFDVAVVKLAKPVDLLNPNISTLCLPLEGNLRGYADETVTVAGWGKPHEKAGAGNRLLQKLKIPVVYYKDCAKMLNNDITPRMICAGELEGGKDTCVGDSGGPLMYMFNDEQFRQVGIVSYGHGCARKNKPGVYTNVQEVVQWIYHKTEDATWCRRDLEG